MTTAAFLCRGEGFMSISMRFALLRLEAVRRFWGHSVFQTMGLVTNAAPAGLGSGAARRLSLEAGPDRDGPHHRSNMLLLNDLGGPGLSDSPEKTMPTDLPFDVSLTHSDLPGLIGLGSHLNDSDRPAMSDAARSPSVPAPADISYATAENRDLRAEVERLRAERNRLLDTQRRIMDLLGVRSADRLVHDLRNVLNERELFKALADI